MMRRGPARTARMVAVGVALATGLAACSGRSVTEGSLQTEHGPLAWWKVGDGPAHVVVHGGPGLDHRYLRPGLDALAQDRALVYYDQAGVGSSTPAPDVRVPVSMMDYLDHLTMLADEFGDEEGRIGLIAHSWGARLALVWALQNPERVRSVLLVAPVEPGTRYAEENRLRQRARNNPRIQARLDSLLANVPDGWRTDAAIRSEVWKIAFKLHAPDPDLIDQLDLDVIESTARWADAVARDLRDSGDDRISLWRGMHDFGRPVLVIHGSEDVGSPRMARELADSLGGHAVIMEGIGHFPWVAAPRPFVEAADTFLSRVDGR